LTVEERLRCIEVCRGWRATLNDHRAWQCLDLARADGSARSEARLLLAATTRACGQLRSLRLACGHALHGALCSVAASNAATLQELRISAPAAAFPQSRRIRQLETLLRAAPQLRTLEADVDCLNTAEAHRVLRNEPPFGPLRVRQLFVKGIRLDATDGTHYYATEDEVIALTANLATHASLASLELYDAPLDAPAALDAVVDAALLRRLSSVKLSYCRLSPASAPALTRLLGGDSLSELCIHRCLLQLLDAPAAALLADALRHNTTLTALTLDQIYLWNDAAIAAQLMGALTAHPRLRSLRVCGNWLDYGGVQAGEAGTMLGALLLANAPALQTLDIRDSLLGDDGMRPVVEALRHNTHLTKLHCSWNVMSEAFARNELLPAVRANASLRKLIASESGRQVAAREAQALVAARTGPA
jgi:hypothetical protein